MRQLMVIVLLILAGVPLRAQAVSFNEMQAGGTARAKGLVTVKFVKTPLAQAVKEIVEQSGVVVIYDVTKLPSTKVSYSGSGVSVWQALESVLSNTNVRVERGGSGAIKLMAGNGTVKAQGVIAGKITELKSGKGISGATVSTENDARGAISGDNGSYRLTGVTTGPHTISVRLVGYAKQSRSITVGEGATVTADFKLEPSANVLDQVVVTGTVAQTELKAVPNAITIITAKQLEERGITRIDMLFRGDVPGLYAPIMGASASAPLDEVTMFSRGATKISGGLPSSSTNPIKTYIDGVEMSDSKYLSQIDPRSIERIEILSGPQASTIYGSNAINGVMQVFTKRGRASRPEITLNLTAGAVQNNLNSALAASRTANLQASGTEGRLGYTVGGSWDHAGDWNSLKNTERYSAYGSARMTARKFTIEMPVRYGNTLNRRVVNGFGPLSDGMFSGIVAPSQNTGSQGRLVQKGKGQTYGLTVQHASTSWWSQDFGVGADAFDSETIFLNPGFRIPSDSGATYSSGNSARVSQRYNTTLQIPLTSVGRMSLTAGGDHWRSKGSSYSGGSATGNLNGSLTLTPQVTRNAPLKNGGAFAQGQLGLWDALFLTYGLRAEWNPSIGDDARVLPGRVGVAYTRDFGGLTTKLRGSYGTSTRPPDRGLKTGVKAGSELYQYFGVYDAIIANPLLEPENQKGGEGGIELYLGNRGSLVVTRYNQTVNNLITRVTGVDSVRSFQTMVELGINPAANPQWPDGHYYEMLQQWVNAANIRNQGWETQGSVNIGPFTTNATYSWTKSRILGVTPEYRQKVIFNTSQYVPGQSFPMTEHTWALGVAYANTVTTLRVNLNGIGQSFMSQGTTDALFYATGLDRVRFIYLSPRMQLVRYMPKTHGYALANFNGSHRFSKRIDGTLQVNNLGNYYRGVVDGNTAVAGRETNAGLRVRF